MDSIVMGLYADTGDFLGAYWLAICWLVGSKKITKKRREEYAEQVSCSH